MESHNTWSRVWLLSLSTMFSSFLHVVVWITTSMAEQYSVVWTIPNFVYPFICRWPSGLLPPCGCCELCCYEYLHTSFYLNTYFQFFWVYYLGVELLGHMVVRCLTYWGTTPPSFYRFSQTQEAGRDLKSDLEQCFSDFWISHIHETKTTTTTTLSPQSNRDLCQDQGQTHKMSIFSVR